ncbi:MAG TPA: HAMP domain-containing sensor histidine kinase [Pyrinomonadaceae bacterium]|jgi:signal transduction histidine kinase|nr:HAMP domain-containing sensor histidine kinase [Pyrinomonadaceae bacterium]
MSKLRTFFRQHLLLVALAAVLLPLFCIVYLQYRSLRQLQQTSITEGTVGMKNYLWAVQNEIKVFYKSNAEQALAVPPHTLKGGQLERTREHFPVRTVEGAKRVFVAAFGPEGSSQTLFFDPRDTTERVAEVPAAEARAVQFSMAPMRLLAQEGSPVVSPMTWIEDQDPDNLVLFRPVVEDAKVVGAAGMILDQQYFRESLLPAKIRETMQKLFPDGKDDSVVVAAYDPKEQVVLRTQEAPGQPDEIKVNLPYFYQYRVSIRSRHMTPEQWATWNFRVTLTLTLLMTAALLGGIVLALRTVSREMRLSQMKTDFVSNVSHELRTPLSSIRVFGEFMKLGRVSDQSKIREYGDHIETESRRLTQLINNILDFSKIESGRKTYRFERASVEEVVAEAVKTCEVRLRQSGFRVNFQPPPRPLPQARVDREAISQALLNLLDNAVKYSGGAEEREVVVRVGQKGGYLRVSVTDHGVGIPADEQKKIFEKFYRVSTGLVHDVKGSGLGLSLVKHIVEAHRGTVEVESAPGRGSTFTISLPAEGDAAAPPETQKPAPVLKTVDSRQ